MRHRRWLRLSLLSSMLLVALAAALLGWAAAERRRHIQALEAEYHQQVDRVRWAELMQARQYMPRAALLAEQQRLKDVRQQLQRLGAAP